MKCIENIFYLLLSADSDQKKHTHFFRASVPLTYLKHLTSSLFLDHNVSNYDNHTHVCVCVFVYAIYRDVHSSPEADIIRLKQHHKMALGRLTKFRFLFWEKFSVCLFGVCNHVNRVFNHDLFQFHVAKRPNHRMFWS